MQLKNEPKLGLELTLKKTLVITTVLAILFSLGVFMYTNLSSTPDTFAGTQGTSNFTCYGPAGVGDNTTNRFCYDLDSLNYSDDDLVSSVPNVVVNNNATYTMGSTSEANALPVEFLYIRAKQEMSENRIDWATAMEENNSHFIIQRTHDGASWESLDEVGGAGFSSNVLKYTYLDQNPYSDVNYYRIKQVDYDGKFDFSQIVMVNSLVEQANVNLKLYPNPAVDYVHVTWGEEEETGKIVLLGLNGSVVAEQFPDQHNAMTFDLTSVKDGVYFIQFVGSSSTKTERLVVRH